MSSFRPLESASGPGLAGSEMGTTPKDLPQGSLVVAWGCDWPRSPLHTPKDRKQAISAIFVSGYPGSVSGGFSKKPCLVW